MVSAGAGNKKALGVDRGAEPVERHPARRCGVGRRRRTSPRRSRSPRATSGGPATAAPSSSCTIRASTPIARTADLFLPVRPGHRLGAVRRGAARADPRRLARPRVHRRAHRRLRRGRGRGRGHDTRRGPRRSPACRRRASSRPPSGGAPRRPGCCCTPAASSSTPRASRTCWRRSTSAWRPASSASPAAACRTITGQGNGQGGREHGHKCDQLPGNRDITNPEHRAYVATVWGCDESEIPGKGLPAEEIIEAIHDGEIKGLLSICFNPLGLAARHRTSPREALDKLEFFAVIDFFLSETAQHADVVLPGSLHEEDEGTSTSGEGRVIKINAAVDAARRGPRRLGDPRRPRRTGSGKGQYFPYSDTEQIFDELRVASAGGTADYRGITWRADRGRDGPVLAVPRGRPSRHAAAVRGRQVLPSRRQGPLPRRAVSASRPRSSTTSTRSGSPPAGSSASTCRAPRPGASARSSTSTPSRCARCTRGSPSSSASPTATSSRVTSRRGAMTLPRAAWSTTIRPDTVFIPYHWPGAQGREPAHQPRARPDLEDARVQGRGGARRAPTAGTTTTP